MTTGFILNSTVYVENDEINFCVLHENIRSRENAFVCQYHQTEPNGKFYYTI